MNELLKSNKVNLSTITRVSGVITEDNKTTILARIEGRTHREVDAIVAEYQPRSAVRDLVKAVAVRVPATSRELARNIPQETDRNETRMDAGTLPATSISSSDPSDATLSRDACEKSTYFRLEGDFDPTIGQFETEHLIQYKFAASAAFQQKVDKVKALGWHRLAGNRSLEKVFELALDCFIDKNDPAARQKRREKRKRAPSRKQKGDSNS